MKIMYLLFSFTVGGTERLVVNICNQMISRGMEVHLYIVNDLVDYNLIDTVNSNVHIKIMGRKVGAKDKISPLLKIARYIKQNEIDVVHCNSFNAPDLLVISKLVNPSCKIVSTIHGNGQFQGIAKINLILRKWICDYHIGISEAVKEDILNAGIDVNKTVKIYNGIDTRKFVCKEPKVFNVDEIVIGCIARIMPEVKGQDVLLRAVREIKHRHPNIVTLFAGGIADNQRDAYENLKQYVISNSLESNVRFLGNVDDIPGFLKGIDICVIPSRSEGFGLSLVEALSMGIPCIASDIAGPKEIITNEGVGELFENGNSSSLCLKIEEVISHYNEFKSIAWNHRMKVRANYSIERMCDKLLDVYGQN